MANRTSEWLLSRLLRRTARLGARCAWVGIRSSSPLEIAVDHVAVAARVTAIASGDHRTLDVARQALSRAVEPAAAGLRELERRLAALRRAATGTIARNAYLTGEREQPLSVQDDAKLLSLPPVLGRFLYYLVKALRPAVVIELGTAHGVSAVYVLAAMEELGHGHLHTIEGDPERRALALKTFRAILPASRRVSSHEGLFADVLPVVLGDLHQPIGLAFDDGDHRPDSTLANFRLLFPRLAGGAPLLIDDVNHPNGNATAWHAIIGSPETAAWAEINRRLGLYIKT